MAIIISPFEGTSSFNRIEVGGEEVSLASIKTTTDEARELVNQDLNLLSSVYPALVLSIQEYSMVHHLVKNVFSVKNLPRAPFSRDGETFCKKQGKTNKRSSCLEHGYQIPFIEHLYQTSLPVGGKTTPEKKELVEKEINQMPKKVPLSK